MKPKILIIQGAKARLQAAYKTLNGRIGVKKLTIYLFRGRYRIMVAGFLPPDEMAQILNDQSLKITEK